MRVMILLVTMHIRSEMEYRGAFLLDRLAQILAYAAAFAGIWILLERFGTLGGWDWPELAFLLSFQLLAYSLGAAFSFVQFREFEELVRRGTLDALLVRPISPWAYLTFSGLNIGYAGHVVLAVGVMIWSLGSLDMAWSLTGTAYFVASLVSAAILVAAIMMMIGASAVVLVQSKYLYSIFFGFWELTRYPMHIYPPALQWLMMTVMPLAFMNYVPVAVILGKDVAILGSLAPPLAILAGPVSAGVAALFWRAGLRRYQSGGG
jgi:ABC-2 type transport system permease protein